jgi:hypothetical protein
VSFDIDEDFELESGLVFSREKINFSLNGYTPVTAQFSSLQLPVVVRYHLSPHLSAGGGLYYSEILGLVESTGSAFESDGFNHADFGALFNVRGNFSITPGIQAIADARYMLGVVHLGPFGPEENREMQFLVGASFTL